MARSWQATLTATLYLSVDPVKQTVRLLTNYGGEAKHYLHSLVTHHELQVRMTGPEMLVVSMAIKSPGTVEAETVAARVESPLYRDKRSPG